MECIMRVVMRGMLCALCLMAASAGLAWAASPDEEAIAKMMNQDLAAAWKENSPGKVLEVFTESVPVIWLDADKNMPPTLNKADRKKELESFFDKIKVLDFTLGDVTVTKISDTQGLVTCTEKITVLDKATKQEDQLLMRTVYEVVKENDKWRAYREISFAADAAN